MMKEKNNKRPPKINFLSVDGIELESNELSMKELYAYLKKISKEFGAHFDKKEKPPDYMG